MDVYGRISIGKVDGWVSCVDWWRLWNCSHKPLCCRHRFSLAEQFLPASSSSLLLSSSSKDAKVNAAPSTANTVAGTASDAMVLAMAADEASFEHQRSDDDQKEWGRRALAAAVVMSNEHAGVRRREIRRGVRFYRGLLPMAVLCFTVVFTTLSSRVGVFEGKDVVDWLETRYSDATTRGEALLLARMCAAAGVLEAVTSGSGLPEPFGDDAALWRFNETALDEARVSLRSSADASSSSSASSHDHTRSLLSPTDIGRLLQVSMPTSRRLSLGSKLTPHGNHVYFVRDGVVRVTSTPRRVRRRNDASDAAATSSALPPCHTVLLSVNEHFGALASLGMKLRVEPVNNSSAEVALVSRKVLQQYLLSEPEVARRYWQSVAVRAAEQYERFAARDQSGESARRATPRRNDDDDDDDNSAAAHALTRQLDEAGGVVLSNVRRERLVAALGGGDALRDALEAALAGDAGLLLGAAASHSFGPLTMSGHVLVASTRTVFVGSRFGRLHVDLARHVDVVSVNVTNTSRITLKLTDDTHKWTLRDSTTADAVCLAVLKARELLLINNNNNNDDSSGVDTSQLDDNDDDEEYEYDDYDDDDDDDADDATETDDESATSTAEQQQSQSTSSTKQKKTDKKRSKSNAKRRRRRRRRHKRHEQAGGLDKDDWKALASIIEHQSADADAVLQTAAARAHSLFLLGDACLVADVEQTHRATLTAGELFGIAAWLLHKPSLFSLTTLRKQSYST
jgi:hypothetical protein